MSDIWERKSFWRKHCSWFTLYFDPWAYSQSLAMYLWDTRCIALTNLQWDKIIYLSTLSVRTGLTKFSFSPAVLGRRHHLHGLGDLLDVLDRLETHRDGLEGSHPTHLLLATEKLFSISVNSTHLSSTSQQVKVAIKGDTLRCIHYSIYNIGFHKRM